MSKEWAKEQNAKDYLNADERIARAVAREEIASLSALVLRRVQDFDGSGYSPQQILNTIFGEAWRDFGDTENEPGP